MGWKTSKLSELCSIQTGRKDVNSGSASGKYPFFTCAKEHTFSDEYSFDCEALLIAGNGVVGNTSYYNGKFEAYQRTYVLSDFVNVLPRFLFLLLDGVLKDSLVDKKLGNTMPYIKVGMLKDFIVPLPPITEQQRIVAILDQAFADIEKARANAERNLKNARELFDSYLNQVFSQRGEGWVEETLGQATGGVYTGPFGSLLHKSDYIVNGIPLINPAHITETGITADENKSVSLEVAERLSSYLMQEGDIVIGRRGEMGRCALVTEKEDGFLCGTGSFFIKSSNRCYGEYLVHFLRSASCKARLESIAGGAVMPNLSNKDLSSFTLYLPSYDIQKELAAEIDLVAKRTRNVASVYEKKLSSLEELKKSLLQKAFSGELTKTEGHAA